MRELNVAAAKNARAEADAAGRPVYVGGSVGPTGEIMEPVGSMSHEEAVKAFAEQAHALKEGGADVLWIETMSSEEELKAAVEGCSQADLPIVTTMSFDTNGRTMMGISPSDFAALEKNLVPRLAACGTKDEPADCSTRPIALPSGRGELTGDTAGLAPGRETVEGALALAARLDEAGLLQLAQVGGDAGLAHGEDLLEFGDGELFAFEEAEHAEAAFVTEEAECFAGE